MLARKGTAVGVLKPFETGCVREGRELAPADALFLKNMSECPEPIATICPYRMEHPLAPYVAARLENISVDLSVIRTVYEDMSSRYELILVEGAGGLLVPLDETHLTLHLIQMLDLPLIVVSRLSLGTINHTLLTVGQARENGIRVAGIIFNQLTPETGFAETSNPEVVGNFTDVPVLGVVPYLSAEQQADKDFLADCIQKHVNLQALGLS